MGVCSGPKTPVSIFSSSLLYTVYTRLDLHLWNNRKVKDRNDVFHTQISATTEAFICIAL